MVDTKLIVAVASAFVAAIAVKIGCTSSYRLGFQHGKKSAIELIGSHIYASEPKYEKLSRGEIRNDLTLAAKL